MVLTTSSEKKQLLSQIRQKNLLHTTYAKAKYLSQQSFQSYIPVIQTIFFCKNKD